MSQHLQHVNALNTKKVDTVSQKRLQATSNYQDHFYYSTINHI